MEKLHIGKRREVFWDDYLIDKDKTTAFHRVLNPVRKEVCFEFEQEYGWLGWTSISYPNIVKVDNGYRMYYTFATHSYVAVAVAESTDSIHWTRPHLNNFIHPELPENNIIIENSLTGAFIFIDANPNCKPEEKYKAVGLACKDDVAGLYCWTSPDGYHFTFGHLLTTKGRFDSMNTAFWKEGRYYCYFRDVREYMEDGELKGIRNVRVTYSEDFVNWTEPKLIEFDDEYDYALYTNNVECYDRAPHLFVGFPTRYFERRGSTKNIEQMGSYQAKMCAADRHEVQTDKDRVGIVLTDCIFMSSRDQEHWHRYNEAFLAPAYETKYNWVYGDCYMAGGLVDAENENYNMYALDDFWDVDNPPKLYRYEIRKDGFACIMADGDEKVVVTKPLVFEGKDLHLNFAGSAYGYIYVDVLDEEGKPLSDKRSFEIYGNTIDRTISFADGTDFSEYAGKAVRLRFTMKDTKLFAMWFE